MRATQKIYKATKVDDPPLDDDTLITRMKEVMEPQEYLTVLGHLRRNYVANTNTTKEKVKNPEMSVVEKPKKAKQNLHQDIKRDLKRYDKENKKALKGEGSFPRFNFNANAKAYHLAMVDHEDDEVIRRLLGSEVSTQSYLPQQLVVTRERPLNLVRWLAMVFADPVFAAQKGVLLEEKVMISSGEVGIHYLAMLTILYDVLRAARNEITLFSAVTPYYNYVRSFLSPRVIDGFSYRWKNVPVMEDLLSTGVPFELDEPGPNHVSLAWLLGTYNQYGQAELSNTIPAVTVQDLEDFGVPAAVELWKRVLQRSEDGFHLIEPFLHDRAERSAAAFAIPRDLGVDSFNGYLSVMSEVPIPKHEHFMSSLMLVDPTDTEVREQRGRYLYRIYAGSAVYNWRLMNQDTTTRFFNPRPRQVPLSAYLAQVLTMIVQADIIAHDLVPKGQMTQPTSSYVSRLNAGDFLMAITSFVLKRYAMNNFLMMGTDSVNAGTHKLGVGMEFLIDYGAVINGSLPAFVTEGMASLTLKAMKTANREYDLLIPYVVMTGNRTNADPMGNNDNVDPLSVRSLLLTMYPDLDPGSLTYLLGSNNPYLTLNIGVNHTSYFLGPAINTAITNFNVLIDSLQGYFDIGLSVGNVHDEIYTLADYSYLCTPFDRLTPWDDSALTTITGMSSLIAFDPDRVSDQLTRIIPTVYADNFDAYVSMTGEKISLPLDISFAKQIITSSVAGVHPIAGMGNETSISDRVITARHQGGGVVDFLKQAGKMAIPAISALLGGVADSYAPGTGQLVRGLGSGITGLLGKTHHETGFVRGLLKRGWINPHAVVFRPVTSVSDDGQSRAHHVTKKMRYY